MQKNLYIARDEIRIIDPREIPGDGGQKNWSLFIGFFEGIFFLVRASFRVRCLDVGNGNQG